nr:DUF3638 domain-containing protein [Gammaproteobacteria bacterium]
LNYSASTPEKREALEALSSDITQDNFVHYFSIYYNIALSGNVSQKAQLERFCKTYLITHRYMALNKQETVIPYLSNFLYRALSNPDTLKYIYRFKALGEALSKAYVPPIEIYQAKDVYHEILTTNQAIWDELYDATSHQGTMPSLEPIHSTSLTTQLGLDEQCHAYRQEEVQYQHALSNLISALDDTKATVSQINLAEQQAGELQYQCIQAQRRIAEAVLSSSGTRSILFEKADVLGREQRAHLTTQWKKIDSLANQAIRDPLHPYHVQVAADQRHELTQQTLLSLYLHADCAQYMEVTGLSEMECKKLHQLIHEGLSLEVKNQQVLRLLDALERADSEPNLVHFQAIANVLMGESDITAETDPALMLFQYADNKLLRERQADALSTLLSTPDDPYHFNQCIEKITMGGGKSKVILPLLAAKKATGLNLVIVEVPSALLATNHADLNSTSQRLFGQKAHRFEFSRDSDCSPKRLETIYQTFTDMMTNKEYLVTTGEAMQSLELKYLELLLFRPDNPEEREEWEKQVYWAGKIVGLMKQNGDVVIDEVHQGLLLKKKLNYTVNDSLAINPELIRHSIALYRFTGTLPEQTLTSELLMTHPESPLAPYLHLLKQNTDSPEEVEQQLRAYLNNQTESVILNQAPDEVKDAFAFYKEQLTLFKQTNARHHKEHYGPSVRQPSALKRALAIPYVASNKPNERSRFGNPLEVINYTIQSLLVDGLNETLFKEIILQWQNEAKQELLMSVGEYSCLDETPTAKRINALLEETSCSLQTINIQQEAQISHLCEQLKHKKALLYEILEETILPQITVQPSILHSDAYNHVDIYRSKQGFSGTPSNHTTYHQDFQYNRNASLGSDGYIQTVLREKQTTLHQASLENLDTFLSSVLSGKDNVRAMIDVNATFAGMSNLTVVLHLADYAVGQNNPKPIEYILYFNEEDILCAYDVTKKKTVILATSDPDEIDQKLGCTAESRLTYYDQSHTIGTDLKQASQAHGIVFADGNTHLQSFLQGCMRMRGLENQQTISLVVPENAPSSLNELMDSMNTKEQNQIQEDNFFAAIAKMNNVVRQEALKYLALIDEHDIDTKYEKAQFLKDYFIETNPQNIFEQYGGIYVEQETAKLLSQHQASLMKQWEYALKQASFPRDQAEIHQLGERLDFIVEQAVPLCKPMSMSRLNQLNNKEVEQQTIHEVLIEKEMLKEEMCFDTTKTEVKRHAWIPTALSAFLTEGRTPLMHPLNDDCRVDEYPEAGLFSGELFVADNYAKVYEGQEHMLGPYLKPVHAILFRKQGDTVSACLMTVEDAYELEQHLEDMPPGVEAWIGTTQHTRLEGVVPEGILDNPDYQSLIEQVRFFNGECNMLSEQKTSLHWLNNQRHEKLDYFEQNIMPYRQTTVGELRHLKNVLDKQEQMISLSGHARSVSTTEATLSGKQNVMKDAVSRLKASSQALDTTNKRTPDLS